MPVTVSAMTASYLLAHASTSTHLLGGLLVSSLVAQAGGRNEVVSDTFEGPKTNRYSKGCCPNQHRHKAGHLALGRLLVKSGAEHDALLCKIVGILC
jgi:hypothetical protein